MFSGRPRDAVGEFEASIRAAQNAAIPRRPLAQFQLTTALSHLREPEAVGAGGTRSPTPSPSTRLDAPHALWSLGLAAFVEVTWMPRSGSRGRPS